MADAIPMPPVVPRCCHGALAIEGGGVATAKGAPAQAKSTDRFILQYSEVTEQTVYMHILVQSLHNRLLLGHKTFAKGKIQLLRAVTSN